MVARDQAGRVTVPTPRDANGVPTDPHIARDQAQRKVKQTVLTGYAQGGTSRPLPGDDGAPNHFAPAPGDTAIGAQPGANGVGAEETAAQHHARAQALTEPPA